MKALESSHCLVIPLMSVEGRIDVVYSTVDDPAGGGSICKIYRTLSSVEYIQLLGTSLIADPKLEMTELEPQGSRLVFAGEHNAKLVIPTKEVALVLHIDFSNGCPLIKVHTPVFHYDGVYPVRPSGLVVVNGLTPTTWVAANKDRVVSLLTESLSHSTPRFVEGVYYSDNEMVSADFAMLSHAGVKGINSKLIVDHELTGNFVRMPSGYGRYVMLCSSLGLKTVCEVAGTHTGGGILASREVIDNLLGDREVMYSYIKPSVCKGIRLRYIDNDGYSVEDTNALNNYHVVTVGDALTLHSGRFVVSELSPPWSAVLIDSKPGTVIAVRFD